MTPPEHYNPEPKFGLRAWWPLSAAERADFEARFRAFMASYGFTYPRLREDDYVYLGNEGRH